MPQPRKPASTLAVVGAYKKNPARQHVDVAAQGAIGRWQEGSTDPATVWDELCGIAPRGVLRSADRPALEMAVRLLVRSRADPASLTPARVTALTGLLGKLGLTPAGRLALSIPASEDEQLRPLADWLRKV